MCCADMVVNWLCPFTWARVRSPPGACPILTCVREHFPLLLVPAGTGHTSAHSWVIPAARVRSDTTLLRRGQSLPLTCMQEFHPLLIQAASHEQGRAALQSDINPKVSSLWGAEQLRSFLWEESSGWRGAPVLRSPVLQGVQTGFPKRPQLKPHRGWELKLLFTATGTNTSGSGDGPISWVDLGDSTLRSRLWALPDSAHQLSHHSSAVSFQVRNSGEGLWLCWKAKWGFGMNCTEVNNKQNLTYCVYCKLGHKDKLKIRE